MMSVGGSASAGRLKPVTSKLGLILIVLGVMLVLASAVPTAGSEAYRFIASRFFPPSESRMSAVAEGPTWDPLIASSVEVADDLISSLPNVELPVVISPAERLIISRIDLDSSISSVFLKNGEWPVPKFIVGHLGETVQPGEMGNAVFAGHLLSLSSGNVFARIGELELEDELSFWSADGERVFRVVESKLVSNKDVGVLASKPGSSVVTLITCAGKWNAKEQDYDQRRIVVAEVMKVG